MLAWTPALPLSVDRVAPTVGGPVVWAPFRTVMTKTRVFAASVGPADECSSLTPLGHCYAGDQGSGSPESGRTESEVRGLQAGGEACTTLVRCSPLLALRDASSVLDAAVARKARLQDCGVSRAGPRNRLSRKKLIGISRLCGVKLRGGEADSLMEFVSHDL